MLLGCLAVMLALVAEAQARQAPLRVFFVDVEGGQATLFVAPSGTSLLIDTGWPGNQGRDADRIVRAAHSAGLDKLDFVLLTHYHVDHAGGIPQLVGKIPVGTFIDHGPNRELDHGITEKDYADYQQVLAAGKYRHLVAQPGEKLPIPGLDVTVISADGREIAQPLAGAGQANPYCAASEVRADDQTENGRSLGVEVVFGGLKILDLGDLTWDKERTLMCPVNKLGRVDILVVSHHGWYQSSSPALVDAIQPRVAIMDNGESKGGSVATLKTLRAAPGLETLWQLHFSAEGGAAWNTDEPHIANLPGTDVGNDLELDAWATGRFTVKNSRTGSVQTYAERP
jgi:beta-lactamase superfamily II metal-dependent hydrolase